MKNSSLLKRSICFLLLGLFWLGQPLYAQRIFINGLPDPLAPEDASVVDWYIGAQVRIIPTIEQNWDMGIMKYIDEEIAKNKATWTMTMDGINALANAQQAAVDTKAQTAAATAYQTAAGAVLASGGSATTAALAGQQAAIQAAAATVATAKANGELSTSTVTLSEAAAASGASVLAVLRLAKGTDVDPRIHSDESGRVAGEHWRAESRLSFEFDPQDKKWNLFMAFECDSIMDFEQMNNRCGNFGLERLHSIMAMPGINSKLHLGWDVYYTDFILREGAGFVAGGPISIYAGDDPGIWLQGSAGGYNWQMGYHKKFERNSTQGANTRSSEVDGFARHPDPMSIDPDRGVSDITLGYNFAETGNAVKFIYVQDSIRYATDEVARTTAIYSGRDEQDMIDANQEAMRVNSNYMGLMYHGVFIEGVLEMVAEYAMQSGTVVNAEKCPVTATDPTGACTNGASDDYTIDANLQYFGVTSGIWRGAIQGSGAKLGYDYLKTSGDAKDDNTLNGFTGAFPGQRFSQQIGSEHSYMGEQNPFGMGTQFFGYIPEYHGSRGVFAQQGVVTGGLAGGMDTRDVESQGGRGDNPGLTMQNIRLDVRFDQHWLLKSSLKLLSFNESFYPYLSPGIGGNYQTRGKPVTTLDMGNEINTEISYLVNWNVMVMLAYTQFIPGGGMKELASAYTGVDAGSVKLESVSRTAMEFIVKF
ncbi:MAG: hypothetical protein HQM12_10775 [SAR324 cluster bacterium]|nr:hypothetical protein [SAR324 cluster bacterium]